MNQLIVIAFDHEDAAMQALESLRGLQSAHRLLLEDSAVVTRDPDGRAHVRNEISRTTRTGAFVGGLVGAFAWFLFPVVSIVVGAAVGALIGSAMDNGVDPGFVEEVKARVRPGRSGLFVVMRSADTDWLVAALRAYRGDVVQTTLDDEVETALREALRPERAS